MVRASAARCRRELFESTDPVDPVKYGVLDDVLAFTSNLAAAIDPFGNVAPVPVAESRIESAETTPLAPRPLQPDLFGGQDATPGSRRTRGRRR